MNPRLAVTLIVWMFIVSFAHGFYGAARRADDIRVCGETITLHRAEPTIIVTTIRPHCIDVT